LTKLLIEIAPKLFDKEFDLIAVAIVDALIHVDFVCKSYILNGLGNTLHDIYDFINGEKV
jgi:hypothetical protein